MTLLQDFPCDRKDQLTSRERFYYDLLPNINRQRPMILETDKEIIYEEMKRYQKEYNAINREKISDMRKEYRDTHKDQRREYEAINREQITERRRQYHIANKEVNNLKSREYRQANLEMLRERDRLRQRSKSENHVCECGGRYTTKTKTRHMNTRLHLSRSKPS